MLSYYNMRFLCQFLLLLAIYLVPLTGTPESSPNWEELVSTDGIKFSGRNAHASCVFKGKIWVVGGRTAEYVTWNLLNSYKAGDVWYTSNGAIWAQVSDLTGDFFAQNNDVTQPGPIAPWYERYGHSLNAVDVDGDGADDMMVLLGGYASSPSNDMWVTEDGKNWVYCGLAPWSPRAWHSTVIFNNTLWLMGGTPLNNEVWKLVNVTKVDRVAPLTRSTYNTYTFKLQWEQYPNAPWSPRVGMGLVSQYYFNTTAKETVAKSRERIVLVGGYGGYPAVGDDVERYDGFISRPDTWETYDGSNWRQLNWNNTFGGRAWMGIEVMHDTDPRIPYPRLNTSQPPKMYIFGGGYIGFQTNSRKRVNSMQGKADAYYSLDGANWVKINYEEGGGSTTVPFFSSQEWTQTVVDTKSKYIGRWGLTVHSFNADTKAKFPGKFYLIAGDFTEGGEYAQSVYRSLDGLYCDIEGVICGGHGTCSNNRCYCDVNYEGQYCTTKTTNRGKGTSAAGGSHVHLLRSSSQIAAAATTLLAVLSFV